MWHFICFEDKRLRLRNGNIEKGKGEKMKRLPIITIFLCVLLMPVMVYAQTAQTTNAPPVEQPLVREGDFAVTLVSSLGLGTTQDEVEAENLLSTAGVSPRNGWIADYPVTPDILGELRQSVVDAANSQKISMSQDEALKRFQEAKTNAGLGIRAYAGEPHEINQGSNYPETSVINNYYYDQGPPVVTYYAPPPDYFYLYAWVPYPFWWSDFWFPGFFILHDFHRSVHFHHRTAFISNHFNDFRNHRVHRIDPVDRFHGRTFAGIGAPRRGRYISPGVRDGATSIFNRNRVSPPSGGRSFNAPRSGGRSFGAPSGGRTLAPHSGGRSVSGPHPGGRSFSAPSGGRSAHQPSGGMSSGQHSGGRSGPAAGGHRK
jgi:hypothetical protein